MEHSRVSNPRVCFEFEVEKIIGVSNDGRYQVQWLPAWVSRSHLIGCEHLIQEFQKQRADSDIQVEVENQLQSSLTNTGEEYEQHLFQQQSEILVKVEYDMQHELPHSSDEIQLNSLTTVHSVDEENPPCFTESTLETDTSLNLLDATIIEEDIKENEHEKLEMHKVQKSDTTLPPSNLEMEIVSSLESYLPNDNKYFPADNSLHVTGVKNLVIQMRGKEQCSSTLEENNEFLHISESASSSSRLDYQAHMAAYVSDTENHGSQHSHNPSSLGKGSSSPSTANSVKVNHSCTVCGKVFRNKNYLLKHLKIHSSEKSYKQGSYSCSQQSSLTKYLCTSTAVKGLTTYSCPHCDRTFKNKSSLMPHIRTHTGEKPFSCDKCSYSCAQKSNLVLHLRTHTGEKPYSCIECGYSCRSKSHLTRHLRVHTGEKPHSCDQCDRSFIQRYDLIKHMDTHTGDNNEKKLLKKLT